MSGIVPLAVPEVQGGSEAALLAECIESGFVSSVGPFVGRFEEEFAARVGAAHAVACASGTAALHAAFVALGIGSGDTVAVADFTFIASVNAIRYTQAAPLLVDSEPATWNLDGEMLHDHVVARAERGQTLPAAIEVVHVLGHPAEMEPLLRLQEVFGIPVIEDASEALGASWTAGALAGRSVGTVGTIGAFSFNGNKIITTGGGGMLTTDDASLAARLRHLTTQARLPGSAYVHDMIGFNYRMTNVAAALGVAQLARLDEFVARKTAIADRYRAALSGVDGVSPHPVVPWARPSHWLSTVLADTAPLQQELVSALAAAHVEARPLWVPMHLQAPHASAKRLGGNVSEDLAARGIALPSSVGLEDHDQDRVIDVISSVAARR